MSAAPLGVDQEIIIIIIIIIIQHLFVKVVIIIIIISLLRLNELRYKCLFSLTFFGVATKHIDSII